MCHCLLSCFVNGGDLEVKVLETELKSHSEEEESKRTPTVDQFLQNKTKSQHHSKAVRRRFRSPRLHGVTSKCFRFTLKQVPKQDMFLLSLNKICFNYIFILIFVITISIKWILFSETKNYQRVRSKMSVKTK